MLRIAPSTSLGLVPPLPSKSLSLSLLNKLRSPQVLQLRVTSMEQPSPSLESPASRTPPLTQLSPTMQVSSPEPDSSHASSLVQTRWYTLHACLKSVLTNRDILHDLFCSPCHKQLREQYESPASVRGTMNEVKITIESDTFWEQLAYVVALIDPMILALRILESDGVPTSHVYERFRELLEGYSEAPLNDALEKEGPHLRFGESAASPGLPQHRSITRASRKRIRAQFKNIVLLRWNKIHTNAIGIAYLLDPSTNPDTFVGTDENDSIAQACKFAEKTGMLSRLQISRAELNGHLFAFVNEKRKLSAEDKGDIEGANPRDWWGSSKVSNRNKKIFTLADMVFSIPPSSASSERAWSIFDFIHTKKRNRLWRERWKCWPSFTSTARWVHQEALISHVCSNALKQKW